MDSDRIDEFEGITREIRQSLASSKILLAYYSACYPTRPACRWELTTAFLAAQREGDPCRRVLAVNPERDASHLCPVEVQDAKFFARPAEPSTWKRLAELVRGKAHAVTGPFFAVGEPYNIDRIPAQVQRPRRFVGRFPELWKVHSALHAGDFPATQLPVTPTCAVAAVTGLPGIGKTALAGQYAFLFRDAFPGGIYWIGSLASHDPVERADEIIARSANEVRAIAAGLGLRVAGAEHDRLYAMLGDHFTAAAQPVLWIIDDVPRGFARESLDRLLVPSPQVRTLITSRDGGYGWDAPKVELDGLSVAEGRLLFASDREPHDEADRGAVDRLVTRCGGHPMVIRLAGSALRHREGIVSVAAYLDRLNTAPEAFAGLTELVSNDLERLGEVARRVLELAAVLAPAPIPHDLIVEIGGPARSGSDARQAVGDAVQDLAEYSLAQQVGNGWRVHPLVADAVRLHPASRTDLGQLADTAATEIVQRLQDRTDARDPVGYGHLQQHARALTGRRDIAESVRLRLLRLLATGYEKQGDLAATAAVLDDIVSTGHHHLDDLLAAARVTIATGGYPAAVTHARQALAMCTARGDERNEYRARLLAAQALDCLGQYAAADAVWDGSAAQPGEQPPGWLPPNEQLLALTVQAVGLRLRGQPRPAAELLNRAIVNPAYSTDDVAVLDALLAARTELARLQFLTGQSRRARQTAGDVVAAYRARDMDSHPRCLEALGIQADATLTPDLTEFWPDTSRWVESERELARIHAEYVDALGPTNPVTLTAEVRHAFALIHLGRARDALPALSNVEQKVARWLGAEHPLRYRALFGLGQAQIQLRAYERSRDILEALLPKQMAMLGAHHPETLETQLELGVALYLTDAAERGRELAGDAGRHLGNAIGRKNDLVTKARAAEALFLLPPSVARLALRLGRLFDKGRK